MAHGRARRGQNSAVAVSAILCTLHFNGKGSCVVMLWTLVTDLVLHTGSLPLHTAICIPSSPIALLHRALPCPLPVPSPFRTIKLALLLPHTPPPCPRYSLAPCIPRYCLQTDTMASPQSTARNFGRSGRTATQSPAPSFGSPLSHSYGISRSGCPVTVRYPAGVLDTPTRTFVFTSLFYKNRWIPNTSAG